MSHINCDACAELRSYAPDFITNGVTDRIAESLKDDTGFNPSLPVLHDNCEDLHDANDCLIGRMGQEVEAYDNCDWKDYMNKLVPNMYELNKSIIYGDCGQWEMIHHLCAMQGLFMLQKYRPHGIMGPAWDHPSGDVYEDNYRALHTGGEIPGNIVRLRDDLGYARCGIYYNRHEGLDCDGKLTLYEWIRPTIYGCYFASEPSLRQVIFQVPVTWAQQQWGFSDAVISAFTYSNSDPNDVRHPTTDWWCGYNDMTAGDTFQTISLAMSVYGGNIRVHYMGKVAGAGNIANRVYISEANNPVILVTKQ